MNEQPTIVLTIVRGNLARNFLQNDFYTILRDRFRLIILTPAADDDRFKKEFGHPTVTFLPLHEGRHTRIDALFFGLHKYLIYNNYVGLKLKYGIRGVSRPEDVNTVRYILITALFRPLSKLPFLREVVRWFDSRFVQRGLVARFKELLVKEHAVLVISTSVASFTEAALIKAAHRLHLPTIGIPKSWDNLSKAGFRAKVDTLAVWSDFMRDQAVRFQGYASEAIARIGVPQFDMYADTRRLWGRERFCREFGLDPARRVILYTSEGKAIPEDRAFADMVYTFIEQGELIEPCSLLIRPHHIFEGDEKKFLHLHGKPHVAIDLSHDRSHGFRDGADYSWNHRERLMNSLAYADVVVNVASTITLDAAAFDKPIINPAFAPEAMPEKDQMPLVSCYETDYFQEIVQTGATVLSRSPQELREHINRYLKHPEHEAAGRELLRKRFCYAIDGKAGERFADLVTQVVAAEISHRMH